MHWKRIVVVFTAGAVLMALEIAGGRLLTPHYGGSVYVWGSLIGIILAALSTGYLLGGKLADTWPTPRALSFLLALAGLFILLIPWLDGLVTVVQSSVYGPAVAAFLLFFVPSVILGMVSPYAIKFAHAGKHTIGRVSGRLYAIATIGSVAGTFLATFWLVPFVPLPVVFFSLGIVTLALAALLDTPAIIILLLALLSLFVVDLSTPAGTAVLETETVYSNVKVSDVDGIRRLTVDGFTQTLMNISHPSSPVRGADYVHLSVEIPFLLNPSITNVLIIGMGGGTMTRMLQDRHPGLTIDNVDIDPGVVKVAKEQFGVQESENVRLYTQDGRQFLKQTAQQYDLIILDTYSGRKLPFHLLTQEFHALVLSRLTDKGIVIANIAGAVEGERSHVFLSEYLTYEAVYPSVHHFSMNVLARIQPSKVYNQLLLSTAAPLSREYMLQAVRANAQASSSLQERPDTAGSTVLTDDYAPVSLFIDPLTTDWQPRQP